MTTLTDDQWAVITMRIALCEAEHFHRNGWLNWARTKGEGNWAPLSDNLYKLKKLTGIEPPKP